MMMNNNNNKSTFARVLATENILVEHRSDAETASFNTETRQLVLPQWKSMPSYLYDMLIGHEVGHALYTTNWMAGEIGKIAKDESYNRGLVHGYANVVEDARIERLMKEKFPGLCRDFFRGYEDLDQRDLFGLEGIDRDDLPLIDRINLHFKLGTIGATVKFSTDEQVFVDRCGATKTEQDVMEIVRDLLAFSAENEKSEDQKPEVGDKPGEGQGNMEKDAPTGETIDGPDAGDDGEDDLDTPEEGESNPKGEGADGPCPSRPKTQEALDQSMKDMSDIDSFMHSKTYVDMPNADLDTFVEDYTKALPDIYEMINTKLTTEQRFEILTDAKKWLNNSNKVVNQMSAEFARKQSATAFRKQQFAKTGILDMQKMVNYKWSEDIFRKNMVLPKGKNHGMVCMVDWSGSMSNIMEDAIKQMVQMALFCRKSNIPFEMLSFSSNVTESPRWFNEDERKEVMGGNGFTASRTTTETQIHRYPCVILRNYLSSRMNKKEFDRAVIAMLYLAHCMRNYGTPMPSRHTLGGTPLDEALCVLRHYLPKFRAENNIEILNCITITDGHGGSGPWTQSSGHRCYGGIVLRDGTDVYTTPADENVRTKDTDQIIKCIRDKTGTKMINFFLDDRKKLRKDAWTTQYDTQQAAEIDSYNKDGFYTVRENDREGYDERFIMRGNNAVTDLDLDDLADDATITKVKNTFVKSLSQQGTSRTMLSKLIDQIA